MLIVLFGPSGTGKSTIGALLARRLNGSFLDADDVHPPSNIEKMARGEPLTDEDRWPWLERIRDTMASSLAHKQSLIVACSALKRTYRQLLDTSGTGVRWVYLSGARSLIEERLRERASHFMKVSMLESQLEALEVPSNSEAFFVDIAKSPEIIVEEIARWVGSP